ncbi:MAG: glycosyltransferase family 39 protein [Phycisphaerales bacterium]
MEAGSEEFPRGCCATLAVCLVALVARLIYLWLLSPYDLSDDEAFYWEWSVHLDWSYATKGPGIAWAIWLATHLLGTSAAAVRTVAAVSGAIGAMCAGGLAAEMSWSRDKDGERASRAGMIGAALFTLAPVFQGTSLLTTIDGPFLACWGVGAWAAWRGLTQRSAGAWVVLGAAIGVGFIFKYTILVLLPGVLVFALLARRRGGLNVHPGWKAGAAGGLLLMVLGLVPVVVWNAQHNWQTVHHLLGHLGVAGGDQPVGAGGGNAGPKEHYSPMWTIDLLVAQAGFLGASVVACAVVVWRSLARRASDPASDRVWVFAWWVGAPVLLMYIAISFMADPEGNWPIAAWVTVLAGAAVWITEATAGVSRLRPAVWRWSLWSGVAVALVLARLDLVQKGVAAISPKLARGVPAGRVMGMDEMAAHAVEIENKLREQTGKEPFIVTQHYGRASRLRFVLPGARWCIAQARAQAGGWCSRTSGMTRAWTSKSCWDAPRC